MRKHRRKAIAAFMAGIMGLGAVFAYAPLSAAAVNAGDPVDLALTKNEDGTKYEAIYELEISGLPDGKNIKLEEDGVDKIGDADLSVVLPTKALVNGDKASITFTVTASDDLTPGDHSGTKTINGYLVDTYKATEVPVLKDFVYEVDPEKGTVLLTEYTGINNKTSSFDEDPTKKDVVIYPQYHVEKDGKDLGVFDTIVAVTKYITGIENPGFGWNDGEYEYEGATSYYKYTGVFAGNKKITSVTFLDGVRIGTSKDDMICSDNIYEDDCYYGYRIGNDGTFIQDALDEVDSETKEAWYQDADGRDTVTRIEGPDMKGMFVGCTSLVTVKNIPDDVVKMTNTFRGCTNLTMVTNLPSALLDMEKTFMDCANLVEVPQIPKKVVNMLGTFRDCKKLNPSVALDIPSSVRNLMETFENCHEMEKTPIISAKTPVRNLFYTFYRCKKMEQLPVLPESVISMFRTFYGCESATSVVNDTPHVIGNNNSTVPVDLIDAYRGCKLLKAAIYIDMDKDLQTNYYWEQDEIGYLVTIIPSDGQSGSRESLDKSYAELFSDSTIMYNCYDHYKLLQKRKDEALEKIVPEDYEIEGVYVRGNPDSDFYFAKAYRNQAPKGMFWEAALDTAGEGDAKIQLYLPNNTEFETNKYNFENGSRSVSGAQGATGTTVLEIGTYASLPQFTGEEDDRQQEERQPDFVYTFNLSYHVEEQTQVLHHIAIANPPKKTVYVEGESFNDEEMVVEAYYELYIDGEPTGKIGEGVVLNKGDYTLDKGETDELKSDDTKVVVSYQDETVDEPKTADQPITVLEKTEVLDHIAITNPPKKTVYVEGESFNDEEMVVEAYYRLYIGGEPTDTIGEGIVLNKGDYTLDKGVLNLGDDKVVVSYQDETVDEPKTADQPITVLEKTEVLHHIAITNPPKKTVYVEGENFDDTGMVVEAYYELYIDGKPTDTIGEGIVLNKGDYTLDKGVLNLGDDKVVVSYQDETVDEPKTADQPITVLEKTEVLHHIAIANPPKKTVYVEGESFNDEEMVVKAYYELYIDGKPTGEIGEGIVLNKGDYTLDKGETDELKSDDTKVVVSYQDETVDEPKTADQPITVLEKTEVLDHIAITNPPKKTVYVEGESFNDEEMVVEAYYRLYIGGEPTDTIGEGIVLNKGDYTLDKGETDELKPDDTKVVVSYQDETVDEPKTADQPITVWEKTEVLHHIAITNPPKKTVYVEGENFDDTEMVVKAYYELYIDGKPTGEIGEGVVLNKGDYTLDKGVLVLDDTKVVVTYQGKTADQPITVTAKPVTTVAVEGILRGADNQPLAGYKVELHSNPQTTVTDSNGYYRFETVETGEHTLYVFDKANKECGTILIHAEAGESSAQVEAEDGMKFDVSVSKDTNGDVIHANGVLLGVGNETKPSDENESTPGGETGSDPSGETQTDPSGETQTDPSGETQSTPSGETQSTPSGETQSTPSGETQSTPSGETQSTPSGETQSTPSGETQPAPSSENESTPSGETPGTGDKGAANAILLMLVSLSLLGGCLMQGLRRKKRA